jgi:hypothetical protein
LVAHIAFHNRAIDEVEFNSELSEETNDDGLCFSPCPAARRDVLRRMRQL